MKTTITVSLTFAAAHQLPEHEGKCARLHGHTYGLEVTVQGTPQPAGPAKGMVMDFAELRERVGRVIVDRLGRTTRGASAANRGAQLLRGSDRLTAKVARRGGETADRRQGA
jgi:hypothetical protein